MNAPAVLFALALCLAAFTVARALLAPRRSSAARAGDLCRSFGLDPAQYRVLGADVGGYPTPFSIRADGLIGRPDAVFISNDGGVVVVGEIKSRNHRGGEVNDYERFQMLLYLGTLQTRFRGQQIRGLLRYRDRVVAAAFDEKTYRRLLSLRSDCLRARAG